MGTVILKPRSNHFANAENEADLFLGSSCVNVCARSYSG